MMIYVYAYVRIAPMPLSLSLLIEFSIYKQSVHLKCIGGLEVCTYTIVQPISITAILYVHSIVT